MKMWAMTLAVQNRVPFAGLEDTDTVEAQSLPTSAFLPSQDDWASFTEYAQVIVQRILVEHIPYFKVCYMM